MYAIRSYYASDYRGQEFTVSGLISGRYVNLGFSLKLPGTITRSYSMQVTTDTSGSLSTETINAEDKLKLPWRGTVGLSFALRENLTLAVEYEYRPYKAVRYTDA